MCDALTAINVEQLSSAVNAVVQSTAIGQVPLDPSPPPDALVAAAPPVQEEGNLPLPGGSGGADKGQLGSSFSSSDGGSSRVHPGVSIPIATAHPLPLTVQMPSSLQAGAGLPKCQAQTKRTSRPVIILPSSGTTSGTTRQIVGQPPSNTHAPQTQAKKVYALKQEESKWILVPTSSANHLATVSTNRSNLRQVVPGQQEVVVHQSPLVRGSAISTAQALPRPLSTQINMNIAVHLPNNGTSQTIPVTNQLNGCGLHLHNQPIRMQSCQSSAQLLSQICNLVTSTTPPSTQANVAPQLMIVPNPTLSSQPLNQSLTSHQQTGPLTSHVTCQVTSVSSQVAPAQSGQSKTLNITANPAAALPNSIPSINLFSPPLTLGPQMALSPLTSQKSCPDNTSPSSFATQLDLQSALPRQGPDILNLPTQQVSPGAILRLSALPSLISPPRVQPKVMTSKGGVKSSDHSVQKSRNQGVNKLDSWCSSCKCVVRGCPHQQPSIVVVDKAVETRARQSIPDLVTFKPSKVIPGETGVFAKQEIQANTRFGPVVGKLADINSSTDLDAIGQKAWRIFSDGKLCQLLFTNDENCSNWMMFIKIAKNHNLMAFQSGANIYFTSFQNILPDEELVVWYSKEYGRLRGIKEKPKSRSECQKCGRRFLDRSQLGRHLRDDHHSSPPCPESRHTCDICSHLFSSSSKLRIHLLTHLGVKPHRCKDCGKGFTDRSNLRAHALIHSGVKGFTCQTCNKSFRQKAHLVSHQVTHTGRRDLQCCVCLKTFGRQSDLSYHMKQHRQVKKVSCPVCDRRFYKDSQMIRHMKIHSGQRDHQCHLCGKGFITKYHLSRHLKSCERYELFRRKPWPGTEGQEGLGGAVSSTSDERLINPLQTASGHDESMYDPSKNMIGRPMATDDDVDDLVFTPSRGRWKKKEKVLRSSRGRPLRPKPNPVYIAQFVSQPSQGSSGSKRRKHVQQKDNRKQASTVSHSGSLVTDPVAATLYEMQTVSSLGIKPAIGQVPPNLSQLVHVGIPEPSKGTMTSDQSASIYDVQVSETRGNDASTDQQQSRSSLSQLSIAVPQDTSVLDCDAFVSSSSVSQSHLETAYGYSSTDHPGDHEIHNEPLSTPLFDLDEGATMSSAAQSMSAYKSFALEEEDDDSHSDAFTASEEHPASSLFITDVQITDPVAGSSSQNLRHQAQIQALADHSAHSDTFSDSQEQCSSSQAIFITDSSIPNSVGSTSSRSLTDQVHGSQEHCSSTQSLFMTDPAMPGSVASTTSQGLDHQHHGRSLTEDSFFSIEPSDEPGTDLAEHSQDTMDNMAADLRAIERALESEDDEEQCTNERREEAPTKNIEK